MPFGPDLVFEATDLPGFLFHMEICEDFWAPVPPSTRAALGGATILANLSASNITIGKSDERHLLCRSQSARAVAAYVYSAAGPGESTTDLAWDGQGIVYELGDLLAESERFPEEPSSAIADVDTGRILSERMRTGTFNDGAEAAGAARPRRGASASSTRRTWTTSASSARSGAFPTCRTGRATSTRTATRPSTSRSRACAAASSRPGAPTW